MKNSVLVYPAIFRKEQDGKYSVFIPDINSSTFGDNLADAIYMARDLIGAYAFFAEQGKEKLPKASEVNEIVLEREGDFVSLVAVDFDEYKKTRIKAVKKTVYVPSDLNEKALELNINFSQVLREGLVEAIVELSKQRKQI